MLRERLAFLAELHPRRFFLETWRRIDEEAAAERRASPGFDYRPLLAFVIGGVGLTLKHYYGKPRVFRGLAEHLPAIVTDPTWAELWSWAWWSGWRVAAYFLLPALLLLFTRESIRDQGLRTRGLREHAWIYYVAYGIVLVPVIIASFSKGFSSYYPFYDQASRSWLDLILWELLYAAQFFSLEFFFRGYWLQACKRTMGSAAIFAMLVPYCMIHFGKPFPEPLGAIFAGIFLGTLAMRTRSIWSGFLIHWSVAVTMDVLSLLQGPGLPGRWAP